MLGIVITLSILLLGNILLVIAKVWAPRVITSWILLIVFSIKNSSSLENVEILNLNENTVIVEEEKYFNVSYVSSSNINNEKIKLFDLKFISSKQYRNFDVNYNSEIIACFINSNNEVEKISDVFVTLTR